MAYSIKNKHLKVSIQEPGQGYRGVRFDWTGCISDVLFDGKYSFGTAERKGDNDLELIGQGFYNEFGIS